MEGVTKFFCVVLLVLGYLSRSSMDCAVTHAVLIFEQRSFPSTTRVFSPKTTTTWLTAAPTANSARVGGVFVMIQRSCSADCTEACTEKGYGIRIQDCTICCKKEEDCGTTAL
ncbi:uncharacterized protein CEXT_741301 [Caerostris extrusa]|uniref:Uncharacterized protein n=1 Tax=Caerostris extrusa TaxID=172846 RepID=A0AAV4MU63_CAEEX|nr:uncharacterized protein CEXT_741301 [Caerostris extrusa]